MNYPNNSILVRFFENIKIFQFSIAGVRDWVLNYVALDCSENK